MPAYIKNGQVVEKRPALYVAYQWIQEIYLALSLFLWSLFNVRPRGPITLLIVWPDTLTLSSLTNNIVWHQIGH